IATVRGDVDLEDGVVQAQQAAGVVADGEPVGLDLLLGDGDDAGAGAVVEAELGGGAHHALGDLAVGLAGGDLEWARQHGPRQSDDHVVTLGEIAGTTDDVLRLTGAVGLADSDLAVADRLLEALQLLDVAHRADDEWPLGLREAFVTLRLEADADETCVEILGV